MRPRTGMSNLWNCRRIGLSYFLIQMVHGRTGGTVCSIRRGGGISGRLVAVRVDASELGENPEDCGQTPGTRRCGWQASPDTPAQDKWGVGRDRGGLSRDLLWLSHTG